MLDRPEQALSYHLEALALFQDVCDRSREADALNGIGECLLASDEHAEARARHATALTLARETGDRQQQGRALAGLAAADLIQGSYQRAIGYYRQALPMFRDIGDSGGATGALNGTGESRLAAGGPCPAPPLPSRCPRWAGPGALSRRASLALRAAWHSERLAVRMLGRAVSQGS